MKRKYSYKDLEAIYRNPWLTASTSAVARVAGTALALEEELEMVSRQLCEANLRLAERAESEAVRAERYRCAEIARTENERAKDPDSDLGYSSGYADAAKRIENAICDSKRPTRTEQYVDKTEVPIDWSHFLTMESLFLPSSKGRLEVGDIVAVKGDHRWIARVIEVNDFGSEAIVLATTAPNKDDVRRAGGNLIGLQDSRIIRTADGYWNGVDPLTSCASAS